MSVFRIHAARSMSPRVDAAAVARAVGHLALPIAIGVELAVLVAFAPDTLHRGWHGPTGDFHNLYVRGRDLELMGMYSPILTPLLYPLHWLGELNAYRAMFAANAIALCTMAYIAQRHVASAEAKIAVSLAIISLPQMHWALRLGHLTPMLGLCALCGLMLSERAPRIASLVLSVLSIKPQYAIAPFLQLLRQRRFSLAATMLASAAAMACIGFATIGFGAVREFLSLYLDWGSNSADDLLPIQQSWMYSWPGVQISLGYEPHPVITFDLMLLSLAIVTLAWLRTDARAGACVTAFAMLLFTPYSQFYDFGLIAVGIALLPRCRMAPAVAGAIIAGLWVAAVATQANTIYPTKDLLGPAQTDGVYWLTPAILVAIGAIAVAGTGRSTKRAG
jgi:hypothetical protein